MTQTLSPALQAHYQQDHLTLARCARIDCRDGQVFGLTDHDQAILIDNLLYRPAIAFPTVLQKQSGLAVHTVEMEGIVDSLGIEPTALENGLFDHARITLFEVNYEDLSQGQRSLLSGFWGETQLCGHRYTTEFKSLAQLFQPPLLELYSSTCRATLGDARCGVKAECITPAGCDKTLATCKKQFNNILNFRGEPFIPEHHPL